MWGETPRCRPQTAKYFFLKKRRRGDKTFRGKVLSWGTLAGGSPYKLRYILHFGQARIYSENVTLLSALRTFPLTGESPAPTRETLSVLAHATYFVQSKFNTPTRRGSFITRAFPHNKNIVAGARSARAVMVLVDKLKVVEMLIAIFLRISFLRFQMA